MAAKSAISHAADIGAALPFPVNAAIQKAGQTCSASSRILVQGRVYDTVHERMAAAYAEWGADLTIAT
ncbi:aldehyde dehydrogenase (NAD+) [Sedimentitalea nanhaiensis]|uniref:Aldehyde dehydrogenase (NAD+) n=1 Tax=Sedimentitalea nanhaiensis TaxID=999627 RepID=A0A1I7DTI0_9RHOB|nr:aldehyde dehydrogenase (NAD+) [Sedimentitalea nanhaiensis]